MALFSEPRFILAPSILSADLARLGEEVEAVLHAGADVIHFDVMDQHYVPNLTFGPMICKALRSYGIEAPIDVHLMVSPVDALIDDFARAGANWISFHPEASQHVDRSLQKIRDAGCKAGLALNPATSLETLEWVLHRLDFILIMSVNPGFGGQSFIPEMLEKVRSARQWLQDRNASVTVAVDGGVGPSNIAALAHAGAEVFVAGSAIFAQPDYAAAVQDLRQALSTRESV